MWIAYLIIGLISGTCTGLFGLGGGLIMVPALTYLLAKQAFPYLYMMQTVIGTSFAAMTITTSIAIWAQQKRQLIYWPGLPWLVPGGIIGSIAGSWLMVYLPQALLQTLFAGFCLLFGLRLIIWPAKLDADNIKQPNPYGLFTTSLIIGALGGVLGIGGRILLVPLLNWQGLPLMMAGATSLAVVLPSAVFGTANAMLQGWNLVSWQQMLGFVYWPAALLIGLSSVLTVAWGVKLSHRLSALTLRRGFGCILILVAIRMASSI